MRVPVLAGSLVLIAAAGLSPAAVAGAGPGEPYLIEDLNPGLDVDFSQPGGPAVAIGGDVCFTARTPNQGAEIWCTGGVPGAAVPLVDLRPGIDSSFPGKMQVVAGRLIFFARTAEYGVEPWVSDGTPEGTELLRDIWPGSSGSIDSSGDVGVFQDEVYFGAATPELGMELWKTDGTPQGTVLLREIRPDIYTSAPSGFAELDGRLYFAATDIAAGRELWVTDGSTAGTTRFVDISPGSTHGRPQALTVVGDTLYFVAETLATGRELWKSDGTVAGTQLVADIWPGPSSGLSTVLAPVPGTDQVVFSASDGVHGGELWISDGTAAGTQMLREIRPGSGSASIQEPTAFGDRVYFRANDGTSGMEPWSTDGTEAGTQPIGDLWPGSVGGGGFAMFAHDGRVYARVDDGVHGAELWEVTDPASAGMVVDYTPGPDPSSIESLGELGGEALLACGPQSGGRELCTFDGTTISLQDDIASDDAGSSPNLPAAVGDKVFWVATAEGVGGEPWVSDGTAAGTFALGDLNPGPSSSNIGEFVELNGVAFFGARDAAGPGLWRSDGTAEGTFPVRAGLTALALARQGNELYFVGLQDGDSTYGLWVTDGSAGRTRPVAPGVGASVEATPPVASGGALYFSAWTATAGRELWRSDGTAAGTAMVSDHVVGSEGSEPRSIAAYAGGVLYSCEIPGAGRELCRSDGTAAGTALVRDLNAAGDADPDELTPWNGGAVFAAADADAGRELWWSDGTDAGTLRLADIRTGAPGSGPSRLTAMDAGVLFAAADADGGRELWITDGTPAGTRRVADLWPGTPGSDPQMIQASPDGRFAIFVAGTPGEGAELWRTDGTAAGTRPLGEIRPGPASGAYVHSGYKAPAAAIARSRVFLAGEGTTAGREPWAVPLTGPGAIPDGAGVPGAPMDAEDADARAPGAVTLTWSAGSCGTSTQDYVVYSGTFGDFDSHEPVTCSTGGATTWTFDPGPGDHYFLVVPHDDGLEGGYGRDGFGVPRPVGADFCFPRADGEICVP